MYRQHTTYSRQLLSNLALLGLIVFSGATCVKQVQKEYWPDGNEAVVISKKAAGLSDQTYTAQDASVDVMEQCDTFPDPDQELNKGDKEESVANQWGRGTCYQEHTSNLPVANPPLVVPDNSAVVLLETYKEQLLTAISDIPPWCVLDSEKQAMRDYIQSKPEEISQYARAAVLPREKDEVYRLGLQGVRSWAIRERFRQNQMREDSEKRKKLAAQKRQEKDRENECQICFEQLIDQLTSIPCDPDAGHTHRFHTDCLKKWVENQRSKRIEVFCPKCRRPFDSYALRL